MDSEDMPDFMAAMPVAPGTADEMLDDADELEGMLEDALEQELEMELGEKSPEKAAAPVQPAAAPPQPQPRTTAVASLVQSSTQNALETMPRTAQGLIDVQRLTSEQHRAYNAAVMNLLTEEQQQRYECFRRSNVKEPMKRLIQIMTGSRPDAQNKVLIALSSVSKSFAGELIEEARRVSTADGHQGPLEPGHVMEAYQRLLAAGLVESAETKKTKLRL